MAPASRSPKPHRSSCCRIEFTDADVDDLPKIDWPKRPQVFKRELADHLSDLNTIVPCPDGSTRTVISLLIANLTGQALTVSVPAIRPSAPPRPVAEAPRSAPPRTAAPDDSRPGTKPFTGTALPEVTPFSSPTLTASADDDARARLNELFPDEDATNNADISRLLDELLPSEEDASAPERDASKAASPAASPASNAALRSTSTVAPIIPASSGGYALFLAKISDEARRAKAVPVLAELGKLSTADAEALSKKVIIPVLKGVTKDEAEAARQRFAKIGILARVKAPE
jgi:hypothetical protein